VSNARSFVLKSLDAETTAALTRLLPQVSSTATPLKAERIEKVLASPSTHIAVANLDGAVVGMALLCVCTTLKGHFGLVEEVAVDDSARGSHVGVHLMVTLLEHADTLGLDFVELTSRPSREAANGLYMSLGFELRETNVYRHRFRPIPPRR
jgi:ribosomal protein S18 acetylase RimI-like enzyme